MNLIQLPFGPHNFLPFFFFRLTVLLLRKINCVYVVCMYYVCMNQIWKSTRCYISEINKMETTFCINTFVVGFGR